jgi:hypothetical protein
MAEAFNKLISELVDPSLEGMYKLATEERSDIRKHVPTLRRYAEKSKVVVELGVRFGVSTIGLLSGQPGKMVSVDIEDLPNIRSFRSNSGATDWKFIKKSSLLIDPIHCDLLFIDTVHSVKQLRAELSLHAGYCRRWIILHDTDAFPRLWTPIGELLSLGRWMLSAHSSQCNGLTILERIDARE